MEGNSNEKNNEKVELQQELFTGLFSTSMFKMDTQKKDIYVYERENRINKEEENLENKKKSDTTYGDAVKNSIVVQCPKHKNDKELEFVDSTEKEDEFSFAEALNFLKKFDEKKLNFIENVYIKANVMLDKAKEFLGIKETGTDPNLKDVLIKLQSEGNKKRYSTVIENIDNLPKYAGKLDFLLNQEIKSTERADLMKISTEIKEAYFNFQNKIKETLDLVDEIIDSVYEKRKFSEVIRIARTEEKATLTATEKRGCNLFIRALNICQDTIQIIYNDKSYCNDSNDSKELLDTCDVYFSSITYINDLFNPKNCDKINQDVIKRLISISQLCASYLNCKPFYEARQATLENFTKDPKEVLKKIKSKKEESDEKEFYKEQLKKYMENLGLKTDSEKMKNLGSLDLNKCSARRKIQLLDEFVDRFSFDNKQLLYKMLDNEIEATKEELQYLKEIEAEQKQYNAFKSDCLLVSILDAYSSLYMNLNKQKKTQETYTKQQEVLEPFSKLIKEKNKIKENIEQTDKDIQTCTKQQEVLKLLLNMTNEENTIKGSIEQTDKDIQAYTKRQKVLESLPNLIKEENKIKENIEQIDKDIQALPNLIKEENKIKENIEQTDKDIQTCTKQQEVLELPKIENENKILSIKSQHKVYFWLCRKYETPLYKILIIGFVCGLIAWVMHKFSKNIKDAESNLKKLETENKQIKLEQNKNVQEKPEINLDKQNESTSNDIETKNNSIANNLNKLKNKQEELKTQLNKFYNEENKKVLDELEINLDNLDKLTSNDIKTKRDSVANKLKELQNKQNELKNKQEELKTQLNKFYNEENKKVLNELGINLDKQSESTSNDINTKSDFIANKLKKLQNKQKELKNKQGDLKTQLNKFYNKEENKKVLNELGINPDNLDDLTSNYIEQQINSVTALLKTSNDNLDNDIKKSKSFIDQHTDDIKKLRESNGNFSIYVKNMNQILDKIKGNESDKDNNQKDENQSTKKLAQYKSELIKRIKKQYKKIFDEQDKKTDKANLSQLAKTMDECMPFIEKQINENELKLTTGNQKIEPLQKGCEKLKTESEKNAKLILENQKHNNASEIEKLQDRIKKLKALYIVINALEQQFGFLVANKYFFGTLNYKLLEAVKNGKELIGKSVNELLSGENATIKTKYIPKDDLQEIEKQQTDEDKKNKGNYNTVLRYGDKFLKKGKIFRSFGRNPCNDAQSYCMGYSKGNNTVLIDSAYCNNIVNEIALFLGFDIIIGSDVVISDGNVNILMMDNAEENKRRKGNCPLDKNDAQNLINNTTRLQKLWDSTSALAFLDIVMMQLDRNPGNYYYNEESVRGIDNDYFAPISSMYSDYYQRNFDEIRKDAGIFEYNIKNENNKDNENNGDIVAMALAKMPVISEGLKKKILSIDKKQFEIQLNFLFRDDINREDKVKGILSRFNKLIELINKNIIEAHKEIDRDIISKIEISNWIVYIELFLVTKECSCNINGPRSYDKFLYNSQLLHILSRIVNDSSNELLLSNESEIEYYKRTLPNILDKKQSKDPEKPLLEDKKLNYIKKLKDEIDKIK